LTLTKKSISSYTDRHSDWYKGAFKIVCDAYGQIEADKFFIQCNERAFEIDAMFAPIHAISLGLLDPIKNFLISIEQKTYDNQVVTIYDNGALAGCKMVEQLEGVYNNAVAQAQAMVKEVSDYINGTINPLITKAKSDVAQISADVKNVQDYINNNLTTAINGLQTKAASVDAQINANIQKINNVVAEVNTMLTTVNSHTSQIQDLYSKISSAPPVTTTKGKSIKEILGLE